jgi:release factor glutamine methyltransferase
LAVIRPIIQEARRHLRPGGLVALEIGMGQREAVERLLVESGYAGIEFRRDLAGIERVASARRD